jgi:hypothetical protein
MHFSRLFLFITITTFSLPLAASSLRWTFIPDGPNMEDGGHMGWVDRRENEVSAEVAQVVLQREEAERKAHAESEARKLLASGYKVEKHDFFAGQDGMAYETRPGFAAVDQWGDAREEVPFDVAQAALRLQEESRRVADQKRLGQEADRVMGRSGSCDDDLY